MMHSKISARIRWSGGGMVLREGQTIASDHPLVAERPDLFEEREPTPDIPWYPVTSVVVEDPPIERGTRAPGEVREGVRRPGRPRKVVTE